MERTAWDNEGNRDYKNLNNKAFGLFKHGHVQGIEVALDERANLHSMKNQICTHIGTRCQNKNAVNAAHLLYSASQKKCHSY